jgi:serine/threonine-protein kinase
VWDEARKHEVEAAVLATGPPYAADVWAAVEQRLDDHATAWVERYAEACEAGSGGSERTMAEVDLRMACLRRCHGDLREAVEVLAHASPTVVSHALTLVDELPAPSRCDDLDASGSTMLEEAADPRVAAAVDELGGRLSRARSLEHAGEYEAGLRAADAVVQEAEPLGHEPLVAEALLLRGHLREETGRYADAEQDLERAYFLAVELGARELELEAASWLIRVVGFQQQRYDEGRHWGRTALAVARRAPLDREGEARALGHIGTTLWKQGELDDALEHHHRAMAMVEEVLGPEHPLIVDSLNTLGAIASTRERWDEALAHHERALELGQRVLGPGHPHVARSWTNLGLVLAQRGELEAAQDHLQRGLVVYEGAYGPEHPRVGQALGNLASVASRRERFEDAGGYATRAIEIAERSQGPDHPSLVSPLSALAVALARQGRLDEATARQRRALAIAEASLPAGHSLIAGARNDLGVFLFELGELDDALVHFRHALGDYEVKLGPDHPDASRALVNIGKTLLERGDLDGAEASFQRAHGVVERALGAEHPRIVSSLVGLANVALARRDHAAAREHAERAVAIFATHEDDAEDRADADFALARALEEQPGERARARALAQGARDVYAGSPGWYRRNLARVKTWIRELPG